MSPKVILVVAILTIVVIAIVLMYKKSCITLAQTCSSNKDCCNSLNCINNQCTFNQTLASPISNTVLHTQDGMNLQLTAYNNNLTITSASKPQYWNWDGAVLSLSSNGQVFYIPNPPPNQIVMTIAKPALSAVLLSNGVIASSDYKYFLGLNGNYVEWTDGTTIPPLQFVL